MNISAFDQLTEDEKLKVLLNGGIVISESREADRRSFLYHLGSFYATVQYNINTDEMTGINAFERIGSEERIKWKVLRALPSLHSNRHLDGLL
jgi:hypothetical protein